MPRIRIHLNCGHGRLIDPDSYEARDILRTEVAECRTCPTTGWGESRYEGVTTAADAKYGLPDSMARLANAMFAEEATR